MVFLYSESHELLGSVFRFDVVIRDEQTVETVRRLIEQGVQEARIFEQRYSRFIDNNDLAEINSSVGEWIELEDELYDLVECGVQLNQRSLGAFNLTVKSVLEGWGYDAQYRLKEGDGGGEIGVIELDSELRRMRATEPIELGGLGKGYVLDRLVERLSFFENFCVNASGDLWAQGVREEGRPWEVYFEHPTDPQLAIGSVEVDGFALACSSPSRRSWNGKHHLVDARRQIPASQMLAVYTQAATGLLADAYATTLFVMGYEAAKLALPEFPVEAMLISPEGAIFRTDGFRDSFSESFLKVIQKGHL